MGYMGMKMDESEWKWMEVVITDNANRAIQGNVN